MESEEKRSEESGGSDCVSDVVMIKADDLMKLKAFAASAVLTATWAICQNDADEPASPRSFRKWLNRNEDVLDAGGELAIMAQKALSPLFEQARSMANFLRVKEVDELMGGKLTSAIRTVVGGENADELPDLAKDPGELVNALLSIWNEYEIKKECDECDVEDCPDRKPSEPQDMSAN